MKKGDRVRLNREEVLKCWTPRSPREFERVGTIQGESRDKSGWRVVWDGTRSGQMFHKDFLLPALDPVRAVDARRILP